MVSYRQGWKGMGASLWQIDANFGQKPFLFDIHAEIEVNFGQLLTWNHSGQAAERATLENVSKIELPAEKVLWMNKFASFIFNK